MRNILNKKSGNDATSSIPRSGGPALISTAATVTGDIHFDGELVVEGAVIGNITAEAGSEAQLRVAEGGTVEGDIDVPLVVVDGTVNGNIRAVKHIELAARGIVNGNVSYHLIEMVMGSAVNGALARLKERESQKEPDIALVQSDDYQLESTG
ncbi:MAG: polymer-forming cytoskeletal protein [Gammaproteobacteria bacterium]|nr:polymer-forming cytoskeletal protein [Gammaproteobacteria bacterium]MCY4296529.1 polymer-forming cytoskeletal protein [Gammaproteobacteria bacterium]